MNPPFKGFPPLEFQSINSRSLLSSPPRLKTFDNPLEPANSIPKPLTQVQFLTIRRDQATVENTQK